MEAVIAFAIGALKIVGGILYGLGMGMAGLLIYIAWPIALFLPPLDRLRPAPESRWHSPFVIGTLAIYGGACWLLYTYVPTPLNPLRMMLDG